MDDIITQIVTLLSAGLTTSYKKYFYGPNLVPESSIFPFIEVVPNRTYVVNRGTGGTKTNEFSVTINIKNTIQATMTSNTNKSEFTAMKNIVKGIEERETNGEFKTATVLGILSSNLKLNGKANIIDDWEIVYDGFTLNGSYIMIGSVTFTVKLLTPNP